MEENGNVSCLNFRLSEPGHVAAVVTLVTGPEVYTSHDKVVCVVVDIVCLFEHVVFCNVY